MKKSGLIGMSIFLAVVFSLAGMAWSEVGVTDTEIKVGTHMALTGPAAVVGRPISDGLKMYLDYINSKGGISGRKFVWIAEDDGFLPSRAKEAAKKLINKDKVFSILAPLQGGGILAAMPDILAAKIPLPFVMSAVDELFTPTNRYVFGWIVPYHISSAIQVDWGVKLGAKKFCFFLQFGPVGDTNIVGAKQQLKKYGLKLEMAEKLKNIKMDYSGLIAKARNQGIDCVVIATTAQWSVPILKEIQRQGWKPTIILGHGSGNPPLLKALAGTAADGAYVTMNHVPTDHEGAYMSTYRKITQEYGGGAKPNMYHFVGYAISKMFGEAVKQVGRDLTREKFIDNLETWKNYDTGWIGKISYSPTDHIGAETMVPVRMVGGKGKVLGPRMAPKQ
ncbi:ABC transporter substrate-binding protein [Thermodesulfobacteriota bacterium]